MLVFYCDVFEIFSRVPLRVVNINKNVCFEDGLPGCFAGLRVEGFRPANQRNNNAVESSKFAISAFRI
jgi:hypothetical protein